MTENLTGIGLYSEGDVTLGVDFPGRIPGDFPGMVIGIGDVTACTAMRRIIGHPQNPPAAQCQRIQGLLQVFACGDVVRDGEGARLGLVGSL